MFFCKQIRQTKTEQFHFKSLRGFVEQPRTYFEDLKNLEILVLFVSSLNYLLKKS